MQRIRVTGGPWSERIGCTGQIVQPPRGQERIYPHHGLGRDEVLILLDNDPLAPAHGWWTCAIRRSDVTLEAVPVSPAAPGTPGPQMIDQEPKP